MVRRSTGNISAVKRGPNRLGPSMDRTLRCAESGKVEDHTVGGVGVSFSFVCSHFFLQDQDQVPGEGGRTVQRYSLSFCRVFGWGNLWRVPQKPIRACCGTAGLHACNVVGSAAIQFNGSLGPHREQSEPEPCRGCWTCRHSHVLTTFHMQCRGAAVSSEVAINGGRRDFHPPSLP